MVFKQAMWILIITGLVTAQYYQDSADFLSDSDNDYNNNNNNNNNDDNEGIIPDSIGSSSTTTTTTTTRPRPIATRTRFSRPSAVRTNRIANNGGYAAQIPSLTYSKAAPVTAPPTYSTIRTTSRPITQPAYYTTTAAAPLTQMPVYTTTAAAPVTQTMAPAYPRPITTSLPVTTYGSTVTKPLAPITKPTYQQTSVQSRAAIQRPIRITSDSSSSSYGAVTSNGVAVAPSVVRQTVSSYGQANARSSSIVVGNRVPAAAVRSNRRVSQVEIGYPY